MQVLGEIWKKRGSKKTVPALGSEVAPAQRKEENNKKIVSDNDVFF